MALADVLLVASPRFAEHETPQGHPERPGRAEVMFRVAERWRSAGGRIAEPEAVTDEALARVHDGDYLRSIAATSGRRVRLDPDTYASPESEAIARLAAGATLAAVDHALDHAAAGLAFVRPPGHHAERSRAMGFCLYNNAAVAAAHARARGAARVAVVDYDVHHGNGTQWIFYDDPSVLYVSTHQYPFYPGTGAADDVGRGDGAGATLNIPLAAGATDADQDLVFRDVVLPVLGAFGPDLLILSAGFDAHADDPLGGMRLTVAGFRTLNRRLLGFAAAHLRGRLAVVTEGGYDLDALDACLDMTLETCAEETPTSVPDVGGGTGIAGAVLTSVKQAQAPYWPALGW